MRWEDERYVRIYTRDTIDWLGLSFIAQGLFCLILRKMDRAGLMKLGKHGKKGVSIIIGFPGDWPRLEPALEELLEDGSVEIRGEYLVVPNFIEAQEAVQSDAQRKRESRARHRDQVAAKDVLGADNLSEYVTDGHETGQKVTSGHAASRAVTNGHPLPSLAVPSRAEPSLASLPAFEQAAGGRAAARLGPLGSEFVARCASGLNHSLAPLTDAVDVGDLELRVEAHGGVEAAVEFIASTCRSRPKLKPVSVKLLSDMLADVLTREAPA